jgi:uncharacterized protein YvpB
MKNKNIQLMCQYNIGMPDTSTGNLLKKISNVLNDGYSFVIWQSIYFHSQRDTIMISQSGSEFQPLVAL